MNKLEIIGKGMNPVFYLNEARFTPNEVKLYFKTDEKTVCVIKFDIDDLDVSGDVELAIEAVKKIKKKKIDK